MNIYSIYHIHVEPSLNSGYIGITNNTKLRFSQHGWKRKNSNKHLSNALAKYKDVIKFSVLAKDLDFEAASLMEEMLRPKPNMGWNIAIGGSIPPSPKGKERSQEYKVNISKAKMGDKNPMFGKKVVFSEEHKNNLSKALTGKLSTLKGKKRPQLTCPHCAKTGGAGGMYVYHFDRCKHANI
jgi:predicted GIY-YIG superfamily endonuclease